MPDDDIILGDWTVSFTDSDVSGAFITATDNPVWSFATDPAVTKRLDKIEERLAILSNPSQEQLAKYESLREAYNHYKVIERLILGND